MYNRKIIKVRIVSQILFWLLFFLLFLYSRDILKEGHPFTIFQRLSIFLGISSSFASGSLVLEFLPALFILILTIFLGRFFCGAICPCGSTIDVTDKIFKKKKSKLLKFVKNKYKYLLLFILLILALAGVQLAGVFDPLSLIFRVYTIVIYPAFNYLVKGFFELLYAVPGVNVVSEKVYAVFQDTVLDYNRLSFVNFGAVFIIVLIFLVFSKISRRFWCRNLCPLGAIYALTARFSFFKRIVDHEKCTNCKKCQKDCRMLAIYDKGEKTLESECIKCFDCLESCKFGAIDFKFSAKNIKQSDELFPVDKDKNDQQDKSLTRKSFLSACLGSLAILPIFKFASAKDKFTYIIRPPGALQEDKFLEKCIRCGQCMKACPTHGLHPSFLEGGLSAIYTPRLISRVGQCDFNCNLCSQVCPTRAIQPYDLKDKDKIIIGTAVIDQHLCFPWSENKNCLVCEEMCPVPTKAIKFKEREVVDKQGKITKVLLPYVITEQCIGCGNCENKCPLEGSAAIRVRAQKLLLK